jgi:hypothetical protein
MKSFWKFSFFKDSEMPAQRAGVLGSSEFASRSKKLNINDSEPPEKMSLFNSGIFTFFPLVARKRSETRFLASISPSVPEWRNSKSEEDLVPAP